MLSSQQVVLLLVTSMAAPTSLLSSQARNSGGALRNFVMADIFNDFLASFRLTNNFLDVFVNRECLKDTTAQFEDFLKSRMEPVTLWTEGLKHFVAIEGDVRRTFREMFGHIVYIICGNFTYYDTWLSTQNDYFTTAFVIPENTTNSRTGAPLSLRVPFLQPYRRRSGTYVLSAANGGVFLNSEFKRNVFVQAKLSTDLLLEKPRLMSGICIHLYCSNIYACEHPSFGFIVELLTHRNASICPERLTPENMQQSSFLNTLGIRAERDKHFYRDFHQYASAGFSFYVRKRDRVPRETILHLPFSWEVWIGLLVSSLVLVSTYGIISMVILKPKVDPLVFILPMVAASFQQSVRLHSSLLLTQSTRVLYGVMALILVVMSTAFKGRLTSLLNDLPLQGEAAQFVSFEDIVQKGHRLCILEDLGLVTKADYYNFTAYGPINYGFECFETRNQALRNSRSIKIAADGRDSFFTYNSPTGPSETLRRELLARGYVETRGTAFSYPVGPEMRASSVYRNDFGVTVSRAIQAGLYVRRAQLAEYKSRSVNSRYNLENVKGPVLNLGDLGPFFLAWTVGMSLSILAFVGETLLARVRRRSCTDRLVAIVKHPSRKKLRRARVI